MSSDPSSRRDVFRLAAVAGTGALTTFAPSARAEVTKEPLSMFAVAFEVQPHPDQHDAYLATAKDLRPLLDTVDGFDSIDRFQSRERRGWLLSLSFWADEAALTDWRTRERHHLAQANGRARIFADYRIRVAQVVTDDDFRGRTRRPARRSAYNDTARRQLSYMSFLEVLPAQDAAGVAVMPSTEELETWDSLYHAGKRIASRTWPSEEAAESYRRSVERWARRLPTGAPARLRIVEVERDYTLRRREAAPQYYPAV